MDFASATGAWIEQGVEQIKAMDVEALARESGFQKRAQRKVGMRDFLVGMLAVAAHGRLTLERTAASIARCAGKTYSKQALSKRLDASIVRFLAAVFVRCFRPALRETSEKGLFTPFARVLLHDSTCIGLPDEYARAYPGSTNQHGAHAQIKAQIVCNLLDGCVEQVSISGFTRNDQRAANDILKILKPGDLILRDLGYFVTRVFKKIMERGAFFVSRYRHDVTVLDPKTQKPVKLAKLLKKQGFFDGRVLLGAGDKLPVRLVAVPVPDAVANERRRKLRQNRKRNPGKEHLFLLGWNIFVTNVPQETWPAQNFQPVYRLRWRIETLFKAFKHHLSLDQLSDQSLAMIRLSLMTRLIFCAFVYSTAHHLETLGTSQGRHVSILRVANILAGLALYFEAALLGLTPQELIVQLLDQHAYYEKRSDRMNFQQILATCLSA
jgi:hypothetical protein